MPHVTHALHIIHCMQHTTWGKHTTHQLHLQTDWRREARGQTVFTSLSKIWQSLHHTFKMQSLSFFRSLRPLKRFPVNQMTRLCSTRPPGDMIDPPSQEPAIPNYPFPDVGIESMDVKRARLQYQSRKRGMLENDLLLATFASEHLFKLNEKQLDLYDKLINGVSNDWDIFYWVVGQKPTPDYFNNEVMDMLKLHAKNLKREMRIRQPALYWSSLMCVWKIKMCV